MVRSLMHVKLNCDDCNFEWVENQSALKIILNKEPTIRNIIDILPDLTCPDCSQSRLHLFDDQDQLLIDPNNVTLCSFSTCDNPIPLTRLSVMPEANTCGIEHEEIIPPADVTNVTIANRESAGAHSDPVNESLLNRLKTLRTEIAREKSLPRYYIFTNRTLEEIASSQPKSEDELLLIHGIGSAKLSQYSDILLETILDIDGPETTEEPDVLPPALSFNEAAQRLAELNIQETQIKEEIYRCRQILRLENLDDTERVQIQTGNYVSVSPQPPGFTTSIKREIKENDLTNIPTELLNNLIDNGHIEESEALRLNEERVKELSDDEQSALIQKGIVNVEMIRKTIKQRNISADDPFIQALIDANIFEEKPNHILIRS
jgi:hypothetical protein